MTIAMAGGPTRMKKSISARVLAAQRCKGLSNRRHSAAAAAEAPALIVSKAVKTKLIPSSSYMAISVCVAARASFPESVDRAHRVNGGRFRLPYRRCRQAPAPLLPRRRPANRQLRPREFHTRILLAKGQVNREMRARLCGVREA